MRRQILKSDSTFVLIGNSPAWTTGQDSGRLFSLVQSSSVSVSSDRQSLKQIGSQHFVVNDVMRSPDVNLNIDYYMEPYCVNEFLLGFTGGDSTYVPAVQNLKSKNNNFYFIIDTEANRDGLTLFRQSGTTNFSGFNAFSVGNCYLNSYSVGFSLGQVPVVSVGLVGSNMRMENITGSRISIPAINSISGNNLNSGYLDLSGVYSTIAASGLSRVDNRSEFNPLVVSPNESEFSLENLQVGGIKLSDADAPILQSLNLNLNLDRTPLYGLGSNYVYDRKLQYPIAGNVEIGCIVSGVATGTLNSLFTNETGYTIEVKYADFKSSATGFYKITDAKLDSFGLSMPVNNTMEFTANFSFQATDTTGLLIKREYPLSPFTILVAFA